MGFVKDRQQFINDAELIEDKYGRRFALSLIQYMTEKGIDTVTALAEELGVDRVTLSGWLSGKTLPRTVQLINVHEKTGYAFDKLIGNLEEIDHEKEYICSHTGLSEPAVKRLTDNLKYRDFAANVAQVVDVLLTSDDTDQIMDTIGNAYCIYKDGFSEVETFDIHTDYATELFSTEAMKNTLLRDAMDRFRNDLNDLFQFLVQQRYNREDTPSK